MIQADPSVRKTTMKNSVIARRARTARLRQVAWRRQRITFWLPPCGVITEK